MNRRNAIAFLIGCFWLGGSSASAQSLTTPAMQQQTKDVATLLEGVMNTTAQAKANPKAPSVQMTTCRVQVNDSPSNSLAIFLYQEQALTDKLSQPYRQRFLEIAPHSKTQTVRSLSFRPTQPERWIGLCNQPITQRNLQTRELGNPVCSVFLKPTPTGFLGETPSEGCPTNARGAVRITNTIELNPSGMNTWDRGFDATGKQVWGAQSESYQFRRQETGVRRQKSGGF